MRLRTSTMLPRVVIALSVCLLVVRAGDHPDGTSKVSRSQDALGNYQFGYTVSNVEGQHFRQEGTDSFGRVVGSYGLSQADGRHRVVEYVADKDGFRARVRSNEPGVENTDTLLERSDPIVGLDTAATSNVDDESKDNYGKRLNPTASRVTYSQVDSRDDDTPPPRRTRPRRPPSYNAAVVEDRDSRQRDIDSYEPSFESKPLAQLPNHISISRPVQYGSDEPVVRRRPQSTPTNGIYRPPIDPSTAVRRPTYVVHKDTESNVYHPQTTTSQRPFIPPYGGFEDEPLTIDRYPDRVSMTNIHGGLGATNYYVPPTSPTRIYGSGHYSGESEPPPPPPPVPARFFHDPVYDPQQGKAAFPPSTSQHDVYGRPPLSAPPPGLLLRAIPISNGIQAVRVNPTTGQIYDKLYYPLYLRDDREPAYDRNILLHNDDASDDIDDRRRIPENYDITLRGNDRPNYRDVRHQPFDDNESGVNDRRPRRYNASAEGDLRLSRPSARDLMMINRHMSMLQRGRFSPPNRGYSNDVAYSPPLSDRFPQFDDDEERDTFREGRREFNPYAGTSPEYLPFEQQGGYQPQRYPRNRRVSPDRLKSSAVTYLEATDSNSNGTVLEMKGMDTEVKQE